MEARGERIVSLGAMGAYYIPRNSPASLARQYLRYGYYRVKTSRRHPARYGRRTSARRASSSALAAHACRHGEHPWRNPPRARSGERRHGVAGSCRRHSGRASRRTGRLGTDPGRDGGDARQLGRGLHRWMLAPRTAHGGAEACRAAAAAHRLSRGWVRPFAPTMRPGWRLALRRLAVYTDYAYSIRDGAVFAERAFALFMTAVLAHADESTIIGRLRPFGGHARISCQPTRPLRRVAVLPRRCSSPQRRSRRFSSRLEGCGAASTRLTPYGSSDPTASRSRSLCWSSCAGAASGWE